MLVNIPDYAYMALKSVRFDLGNGCPNEQTATQLNQICMWMGGRPVFSDPSFTPAGAALYFMLLLLTSGG